MKFCFEQDFPEERRKKRLLCRIYAPPSFVSKSSKRRTFPAASLFINYLSLFSPQPTQLHNTFYNALQHCHRSRCRIFSFRRDSFVSPLRSIRPVLTTPMSTDALAIDVNTPIVARAYNQKATANFGQGATATGSGGKVVVTQGGRVDQAQLALPVTGNRFGARPKIVSSLPSLRRFCIRRRPLLPPTPSSLLHTPNPRPLLTSLDSGSNSEGNFDSKR